MVQWLSVRFPYGSQAGTLRSGYFRLSDVPPRLLRTIDVCCRGSARTGRGGTMVEVDRGVGGSMKLFHASTFDIAKI